MHLGVAEIYADELHQQKPNNPVHAVTAQAFPNIAPTNPAWTYQEGDQGLHRCDHMIRCLLDGIEKNTYKTANSDTLREVTHGPDEICALFMSCLTEVTAKYTNMDPEIRERLSSSISSSFPSLLLTLARSFKLQERPQNPTDELIDVAFSICNNQKD